MLLEYDKVMYIYSVGTQISMQLKNELWFDLDLILTKFQNKQKNQVI